MSPVSGNPKGDVTLVEFFDYQCGYCKRSLKPVRDLLETDRQLRIVWKEFPILGPVSRFAARAAMASENQGRYLEFHVAVMGSRGKLTEDRVMTLAGSVGLDVQRLRRDMDDPAIEEYLDETIRLAQVLGIRGTPAFVIGDTLVPGVVGDARLKELIAKARSGSTPMTQPASISADYTLRPSEELLSKVGDGGFQAARSISFSPSLNLTPSTISARR